MRVTTITAGLLSILSACGTIENETYGEIQVYGKTYTTVTREFDQNGQTVLTGSVVYNSRKYGCNTLLPGDCERRVALLFDSDTLSDRFTGAPPASYVISDPNKPSVNPFTISF